MFTTRRTLFKKRFCRLSRTFTSSAGRLNFPLGLVLSSSIPLECNYGGDLLEFCLLRSLTKARNVGGWTGFHLLVRTPSSGLGERRHGSACDELPWSFPLGFVLCSGCSCSMGFRSPRRPLHWESAKALSSADSFARGWKSFVACVTSSSCRAHRGRLMISHLVELACLGNLNRAWACTRTSSEGRAAPPPTPRHRNDQESKA